MKLSAFDKGMLDGSETSPLTRVVVFIKLWFYKGKTILSSKTDVSWKPDLKHMSPWYKYQDKIILCEMIKGDESL